MVKKKSHKIHAHNKVHVHHNLKAHILHQDAHHHAAIERFKTGVPGFDSLFQKGIPVGASVLVEGGPGSGKTIFCLTFAKKMCEKGKKVLYMSFEEPEERLRLHLREFGAKVEESLNEIKDS